MTKNTEKTVEELSAQRAALRQLLAETDQALRVLLAATLPADEKRQAVQQLFAIRRRQRDQFYRASMLEVITRCQQTMAKATQAQQAREDCERQ